MGSWIFDPRSTIFELWPGHAGRLPPVVAHGGVGVCHWGRGDGGGGNGCHPLDKEMQGKGKGVKLKS